MKYIVIVILTIIIVGGFQAFKNKKGNLFVSNTDLLEAGQLLFPKLKTEFEHFFLTFLKDKKTFLVDNAELLEDYDNFELDKLKPIEVIFIFGDSKENLWITDWRGEENEREIENFIENKLKIKSDWTNTRELRKGAFQEKHRDGEYIIDLFKTIDTDLETLGKRIIFIDFDWDAYVFTVVDQSTFKTLIEKFGTHLHGTEKLKK
jgi:hypothetical protein